MKLVCKPGRGVLARLGRSDEEFGMAMVRCEVFEPRAAELERRTPEFGIPFWPHAFVRVEGDIERLVQCWNNEYVAAKFRRAARAGSPALRQRTAHAG